MSQCHIMLGKIGDILSILPFLKWKSDKDGKPINLVVSKQYADIVSNLDYVEADIIDCHWQDLEWAMKYSKRKYDSVLIPQTYGKTVAITHRTPSFQYDQWQRAGAMSQWDNIPLIVPKAKDSAALVERHLGTRPSILFADSGESSQFEFSNQLFEALRKEFGDTHQIVRLSTIRLERFTDFVALYDAADVLVVTETAHLHLSKATDTPTFALITDIPQRWHGSAWSEKFGMAIRYSQYELREMEFLAAIRDKLKNRKPPQHWIYATVKDHGYNPSIIEYQGKRLMSYRFHPNPKEWRTNLAMVEEHTTHNQEYIVRFPDRYSEMSQEDGRLFMFNGKLHMSFTLAAFPGVENVTIPCATGYGELIRDDAGWRVDFITFPKYGVNNFQGQEKNFVFFESSGKLHCIYQCSPEHIVLRLGENGVVDEVYRTESPSWKYGEIRGGTQPLSISGKWLRFFHSLNKNGKDRSGWTYHMGAMTMASTAPFKIEKISSIPIMSGNEKLTQGWRYWKASVCIPYGAIENEDGWDVGVGLNDSQCAIVRVKKEHLNL